MPEVQPTTKLQKNKELLSIATAFHYRQIDKIYVYIKNFGGLYAGRTKDGMTIGYLDKLNKIGKEDHVTVFYNTEVGFSGLHRTIIDSENVVYLRYSIDYITRNNGLKLLLLDILNDEQTPSYMKAMLLFVFYEIRLFYKRGVKKTVLLSNSKAKALKMKSPCIFIETGVIGKIQLTIFSKLLPFLHYYSEQKFANNPSRGFQEKKLPGAIISKKSKL
ncbi:MAG: hypothetical protein ACQCN4_13405 [Candidatus Bathyarchaeia archaeon]|jgi:hypothetical protein